MTHENIQSQFDLADEGFELNPDINQVSTFLRESWPLPVWDYSPKLLNTYYQCPDKPDMAAIAYRVGNEIAGYLGYIPDRVRYHEISLSVVCGKWWCVSPRIKCWGLSQQLHKELIDRFENKNFDGLLLFTHADSKADKANRNTMIRLRKEMILLSNYYEQVGMVRMIKRRISPISSDRVSIFEPYMDRECSDMFKQYAQKVDFCLEYTAAQAGYLFRETNDTKSWIFRTKGKIAGLINGNKRTFLEPESQKIGVCIEHMILDTLTPEEVLEFLRSVFLDEFWSNVDFVCIPCTGCHDPHLFQQFGFLNSTKEYNLYIVPLMANNRIEFSSVNNFCFNTF